MVRVLLEEGGLPKRSWGYAAQHAANIMNMTLRDEESTVTPFERFYRRRPLWQMLKPFGCRAVAYINKDKQAKGKLGVRGRPGRYAGFNPTNNSHLLLHDGKDGSVGHLAIEAVHVDFHEGGLLPKSLPMQEEEEDDDDETKLMMDEAKESKTSSDADGPGWRVKDLEQAMSPSWRTNDAHDGAGWRVKDLEQTPAPGWKMSEVEQVATSGGRSQTAPKDDGDEDDDEDDGKRLRLRNPASADADEDDNQGGDVTMSSTNDEQDEAQARASPLSPTDSGGGVAMEENAEYDLSVDSGGGNEADGEKQPRRSTRSKKESQRYAEDFFTVVDQDEDEDDDAQLNTLAVESLFTIEDDEKEEDDEDLQLHAKFALMESLDDRTQDEPDVRKVYTDPQWRKAIQEEMDSLEAAGTFERVRIEELTQQERESAIESTLKLKRKRNEHGKVVRWKARLCARGDQYDSDHVFGETFAPTPKLATIRMVLFVMAALSLSSFQLDVKSAFVQACLLESVYLIPCREAGLPPGTILRCLKSLYGLPQAGANWYQLLKKTLLSAGLTESVHDGCLFYLKKAGSILLCLFHVDDLIFVGPTQLVQGVVRVIQAAFPTTGSPTINHYTGMTVTHHEKTIGISAGAYIDGCMNRFGLQHDPFVRVPITARLNPRQEQEPRAPKKLYQAMVGSILWLARLCRPDIAFASHELCRHTSEPGATHLKAAQRVMQYLRATRDYGLVIPKNAALELSVHCDADFHRVGSRKPTTGIIVSLGTVPIDWRVKTQTRVACSTFESEVTAAFGASRKAITWKRFLQELQLCHGGPVPIYEDNQAVTYYASHTSTEEKMEHLPAQYHFIKECQREGQIRLTPIASRENIADVLTKPLPASQFEQFREALHVHRCERESVG
jgi:hypothetical protein